MPRIIRDPFSYPVSFELCGRGTLRYCLLLLMCDSCKIGTHGNTLQINESKFVKRNYYCGHRVEGQWVFGGIEEDSRKCFILTVGYHSETTVLPIIKEWIALGNIIISGCWKSYVNVEKHGYTHETVNHSKEFVNKNGKHKNKIEASGSEDSMARIWSAQIRVFRTYCGICGVLYIKTRICWYFFCETIR